MLSGMPEPVSDNDELFLPQSTSEHGFVHLQSLQDHQHPGYNNASSEISYGYFTNSLMHVPKTLDNDARDESDLQQSDNWTAQVMEHPKCRTARQGSIVDGLLHEIYDRWHYGRNDSIDSDTLTECSSTSDVFFYNRQETGGYHSALEKRHGGQLNKSFLQNQSISQLQKMLTELQRSIAVMNVRLVKQLKRRDRRQAKLQRNFDIVTAILQAASLKRQIDTRMKFSIQPPLGESAFDQWRDAMRAVCRLPMGMPPEFRKKVWLSLADHYLFQLKINWEQTIRFSFNERSNPDDEQLGMQIVKDLHRTGCSNFSGDDNDEDRAVLKRLLLAYARWNKRVGYCQGFNVIAALLLNVMDRKEDDALKVMIYLIDSVLPESYFANNLRALSVDMAVFRDLLRLTYPKLSKHLDRLQLAAQDVRTGACYEPPLTNVFTMQWFLTLFATCLPVSIVLRVWDSVLLEGSEVLLRTALTIWGKLAKRIMGATSADEFYSLMGELSSSVMQGSVFDGDTMVKSIYSVGDFPLPHLNELREKYTYNIRPISQPSGNNKKNGRRSVFKSILNSDEDDIDDDDIAAMACFPGNVTSSDISVLGPGVYGSEIDESAFKGAPEMERMTTDIHSLKLQYERLRQRQRQAHIIIAAASAKKVKPSAPHRLAMSGVPSAALVPSIESPVAMNHLFLGKASSSARNRLVTDGPRICAPSHHGGHSPLLTKQLQAVASAHAVSKSKRMKTCISGKAGTGPAASSKAAQVSASPETTSSSTKTAESTANMAESSLVSGDRHVSSSVALNVKSNKIGTFSSELERTLSDSNVHNTESAIAHEQSPIESVRSNITDNTIDLSPSHSESIKSCIIENADLPPTKRDSEDVMLSDIKCVHEEQFIQFCEKNNANSYEVSTQNAEKEFYLLNLNSGQHTECENADSKTDMFESEHNKDNKHDIPVCSSVQSSSTENLNSEVLSVGLSDIFTGGISSMKSVMEDSGFQSPSATSPMMMLDRKLCHQDTAVENDFNASKHEEDMVLFVEETTTDFKDQQIQVSQNEVSYNVSNDNIAVLQSNLINNEDNTDASFEPDSNVYTECGNLDRNAFTAKGREKTSPPDFSRSLSTTQNDSIAEESPMVHAAECSTPHREFFARSSSVIETVSVPAVLDVRKFDIDQSSTSFGCMHKPRKTSSSNGESDQEEGVFVMSNSNLERKSHDSVISHKPSSQHKKTRRFSSPAGPVSMCVGSHTGGHHNLVKTACKPFNPFPVRHFNANRAKTGLKLGLYSESTLEKLRGLKPRTSSS